MSHARRAAALALVLLAANGCGTQVETTYGKVRSESVNGTGVVADLFRERGHEVRTAVRLTDELRDWADVIVRFAPSAGPPERDEADWYDRWLNGRPARRLVYVPRDYDASVEYWTRARDQLPGDVDPRTRERVDEAIQDAKVRSFPASPPRFGKAVPRSNWFEVEAAKPAAVCKTLGGPWSEGVDPAKAALTRHETIKVGDEDDGESVPLTGDGAALVVTLGRVGGGRTLVVAGGTFLLNLPMTEPARWPLALRTVDWATGLDPDEGDMLPPWPRRVAFVEGPFVLADPAAQPSVFALLKVPPFGFVAAQLFALGLAACLARAPRLGRARAEEPSGAERPAAHPEALGLLLARTGQAREARSILDAYRRWRHGPGGRGPAPP